MPQIRQPAAIMFTVIVGYTTLMGDDQKSAFELLNKAREIEKPLIEQYEGKGILRQAIQLQTFLHKMKFAE